jgi:hypothetical protein
MPGGGGTDINYNWPSLWEYDIDSTLNALVDSDLTANVDSSIQVLGNSEQPVTLKLEPLKIAATTQFVGSREQPVTLKLEPVEVFTTLRGDPKAPISTRSEIEFTNLPRLNFDELITVIKTFTTPTLRIHFPVGLNFAFSFFPLNVLGYDAATFSICGEQQVITQAYVPNRFERCDVDCEPVECGPGVSITVDE